MSLLPFLRNFIGVEGDNAAAGCTFPAPYSGSATDTANLAGFCTLLPPGFEGSVGPNPTTNSYSQTYSIQVLRDSTQAGQPPSALTQARSGP